MLECLPDEVPELFVTGALSLLSNSSLNKKHGWVDTHVVSGVKGRIFGLKVIVGKVGLNVTFSRLLMFFHGQATEISCQGLRLYFSSSYCHCVPINLLKLIQAN